MVPLVGGWVTVSIIEQSAADSDTDVGSASFRPGQYEYTLLTGSELQPKTGGPVARDFIVRLKKLA